jgi:hypothetical protein
MPTPLIPNIKKAALRSYNINSTINSDYEPGEFLLAWLFCGLSHLHSWLFPFLNKIC